MQHDVVHEKKAASWDVLAESETFSSCLLLSLTVPEHMTNVKRTTRWFFCPLSTGHLLCAVSSKGGWYRSVVRFDLQSIRIVQIVRGLKLRLSASTMLINSMTGIGDQKTDTDLTSYLLRQAKRNKYPPPSQKVNSSPVVSSSNTQRLSAADHRKR